MNWYLQALKRYAEFSGRSRRKEYWYFALFNFLIGLALGVIESVGGLTYADMGILSLLYSLAILVPSIAVTIRRLHDTGRSGWWLLLVLVPVVGWLVLLVFMVMDSEPGRNGWGPNPKGAGEAPAMGTAYPAT